MEARASPRDARRTRWPVSAIQLRRTFRPLGPAFVARPGKWIGAKVGLFASAVTKPMFDASSQFEPTEVASLIVAQDGSGDFRTIQEALDAIPVDNEDNRTILVRNGVYREKVMIGKPRGARRRGFARRRASSSPELRRNWRAIIPMTSARR